MGSRIARRIGRLALRTVLLVVVPLVAAAVGVYLYAESGRYVTTENAYIKSNVVSISADVSGRVEWVGIDNNSLVRKGQVLFRLDQQPFKIALEHSEAELGLVRTRASRPTTWPRTTSPSPNGRSGCCASVSGACCRVSGAVPTSRPRHIRDSCVPAPSAK